MTKLIPDQPITEWWTHDSRMVVRGEGRAPTRGSKHVHMTRGMAEDCLRAKRREGSLVTLAVDVLIRYEDALRWYADDLNCTDPQLARMALGWPDGDEHKNSDTHPLMDGYSEPTV